ncbi:MAG: DNA polymerase III subunit alpha [Hydrogenophilaceae bacterium]|jgi:DNA polymerase-3 subunit alpha|nr:DNA polymerase III subunit alpha [Hydrogenophilaceae bacterium]
MADFDKDSGLGQGVDASFVHLRARSAYSLLESMLHVKALAREAALQGMPALGLTDANNLFGALEFSEAAKGFGVQPIIGCALSVRAGADVEGALALLAQNQTGYQRLMQLASAAHLEVDAQAPPHVALEAALRDTEGLIALTGGGQGPLSGLIEAGKIDEARALLRRLAGAFPGRLYVELQRHGEAIEAATEEALVALAYDLKLPLVATNDIRFRAAADHKAHDALTCIAHSTYLGEPDRPRITDAHRFKTAAEMRALFPDLPEAIENSVEIAQRCAFRVKPRAPILPRFTTEAGRDEPAELRAQAEAGLKARLAALGAEGMAADEATYKARLDYELGVIIQMKFAGYFLIVADFIQWAKQRQIPVGPGRGSGAGSVVAWALTITDLDPLRFGLLFERFLNPERVSMPDFDIDFCQERRGEVIEYVKQRYGEDRVAQIITFGTLQARAVVRDVGRVMQLPFGQVDRLAKMIPANPADPVTLEKALSIEPRILEMARAEPEINELLATARELEGLHRNASTHAAGVVIGDRPLTELVALYRDPRSDLPATQFNMKWVEAAGLVKFDFLGLKTLTVIDRAVKFLRQRGIDLDLSRIGFDDEKTYTLMQAGATFGVFQLEGQGMRDTLRKVRPTKLDDIIALISLYRPGPMKNIDSYANVKHGIEQPLYPHPLLQPILEETYGVIIYQEQVMQIAQVLSGYSLGEADLLRRAMGKKLPEEMRKQKDRFIEGAKERGVKDAVAGHIFDLVEEFAGYGFNKSHAAAYAVIAYQTAYLKANHPVEFTAASMSLDISNSEKLAAFMQDARRIQVRVLPPDINASEADFSVEATGEGAYAVRYALGAVRNVGLSAMEGVVAERKANGPYRSLFDFAERLDAKAVNRRQLENLAKAGAFDRIEPERARVFAASETLAAYAARAAEERESAQASLFGAEEPSVKPLLPKAQAWSAQERLDYERESVGFYLSGHPLADFYAEQDRYMSYADLVEEGETEPRAYLMAGVLRAIKSRPANSGGTLAWATFSDPTGEYEAIIMPEHYAQAREILAVGKAFVFRGKARWRDGDLKMAADMFEPVESAEARQRGDLRIIVREGAPLTGLAETLSNLPASGDARPLKLVIRLNDGREVEVSPPGTYPASPAARAAMKAAKGVERVI